MSKVIICIHGLGNKPHKKLLTKWWRTSIQEGLRGIGKYFIRLKIEMVYWADLLYLRPLDENITDPKNELYLCERYYKSTKNYKPKSNITRRKILDFIEKQIDRLFLNEDQSVNYSFISDFIIHKYFKDLEIYYSDKCNDGEKELKRIAIRKRFIDTLDKHKNDEILLIAHSMGTIIAYDVLWLKLTETKIDTFITIGSPLGIPIVISKIAQEYKIQFQQTKKLAVPEAVRSKWYNFSDLEDKVASNYNLADDYEPNGKGIQPTDFIVTNDYFIDGERNPHKAYGYLRTRELAKTIYEFLIQGKPKIIIWVFELINKLIETSHVHLKKHFIKNWKNNFG